MTADLAVLRPARPRLAEALAALTEDTDPTLWSPDRRRVTAATITRVHYRTPPAGMGVDGSCRWAITDLREAREALAMRDVIPLDWIDDPARRFVCPQCGGSGAVGGLDAEGVRVADYCPTCLRPDATDEDTGNACAPLRAHPWSVTDCVALASDPAGIATAEALAREVAHRLAPWGAPQPERVAWRAVGAHRWTPACWKDPPRPWAPEASPLELAYWQSGVAGCADAIASAAADALQSELNTRHDNGFRFADGVRPHVVTVRHAAIAWRRSEPNPFAPLAVLHGLGYALDGLDTGAVTLVCPALEGGRG